MTLRIPAYRHEWFLTGVVPLVNDLDVHQGDRVRLTQEAVAAGPGGAGVGGMGVVVEKVEGEQQRQQQQGRHRRRRVRTAVQIGKPHNCKGGSVPVLMGPPWFMRGPASMTTARQDTWDS